MGGNGYCKKVSYRMACVEIVKGGNISRANTIFQIKIYVLLLIIIETLVKKQDIP